MIQNTLDYPLQIPRSEPWRIIERLDVLKIYRKNGKYKLLYKIYSQQSTMHFIAKTKILAKKMAYNRVVDYQEYTVTIKIFSKQHKAMADFHTVQGFQKKLS